MFSPTIFSQVRTERDGFINDQIEIVDGYRFNQYDTIKKIHKYYSGHYDESDYEVVNGITRKKIFHNINKWRCMVATKMIDVDTSQIKILSKEPKTDLSVYLLEKELSAWLQTSRFGKTLNRIVEWLPRYGSVVLRKTANGADLIDLRNIFLDQSVDCVKNSSYVIVKHQLSARELRRKLGKWQNVNELLKRGTKTQKRSYVDGSEVKQQVEGQYYDIYERWGECPKSWITGKQRDEEETVFAWMIVAGVDDYATDDNGKWLNDDGLVLFSKEINDKDFPLIDIHYNKVEGRWLGVGVVEDTFEDQRVVNRVKNQEAKALELSALMLLTTPDKTIVQNVLSDLENGDVIQSQNGINRIDNRNLASAEFNTTAQAYEQHADRATFSYDVVRGEQAPASATLGSVQIQAQQASSVYDFIRENIGLELEKFFEEIVIPQMLRDKKENHFLKLQGNDKEVEDIRKKIVDDYFGDRKVEKEDYERALKEVRAKNSVWVEVQKGFYDNLEYYVRVVITGEGVNVQTDITNINQVLSLVAKSPDMLNNPVLKRLTFKLMSKLGMNISELEVLQDESAGQQEQLSNLNAQQNVQPITAI